MKLFDKRYTPSWHICTLPTLVVLMLIRYIQWQCRKGAYNDMDDWPSIQLFTMNNKYTYTDLSLMSP